MMYGIPDFINMPSVIFVFFFLKVVFLLIILRVLFVLDLQPKFVRNLL